MTSYSAMSARGRDNAREATAGRRKVIAERIEYVDTGETEGRTVTALPGVRALPPPRRYVAASLIGSCGHRLRWLRIAVADGDEPNPGRYLTDKVGRRMTCPHEDCRIPEHVYTDADCEYLIGEVERRCTTLARWDTPMGRVCTRHRNHYVREGYLTEQQATPLTSDTTR